MYKGWSKNNGVGAVFLQNFVSRVKLCPIMPYNGMLWNYMCFLMNLKNNINIAKSFNFQYHDLMFQDARISCYDNLPFCYRSIS